MQPTLKYGISTNNVKYKQSYICILDTYIYIHGVFTEKPYSKPLECNVVYIPITALSRTKVNYKGIIPFSRLGDFYANLSSAFFFWFFFFVCFFFLQYERGVLGTNGK